MISQQFIRSVKLHKEKQGLEPYVAGLAILKELDCLEMDKAVTFFKDFINHPEQMISYLFEE